MYDICAFLCKILSVTTMGVGCDSNNDDDDDDVLVKKDDDEEDIRILRWLRLTG